MSLEDTVNDASKCGVPDALSYLFSILFFAPSPSEQTLMNVKCIGKLPPKGGKSTGCYC